MTTAQLIKAALAEDGYTRDRTSQLVVPSGRTARCCLVARAAGILCGIEVCAAVFRAVDRQVEFTARLNDGQAYRKWSCLAEIQGRARSLLAAERSALNFLQRLSGIATLTRRYVEKIKDTGAVLLDTRKTTPGWRKLEKYAVRCGGGTNHRHGLYDMVLIKDNHIAIAGSVTTALERCRKTRLPVEVEVRTLAELSDALAAGATRILLDNMSPARLRRAVALNQGRARLEASGGVNLGRIRRVAETGVDFISVGAITQSAPAADIALDFIPDHSHDE